MDHPDRAAYIDEHGKAEPFGPPLPGYAALPEAERRAKAAALAPAHPRPSPRTDKPHGRPLHRRRRRPRLPGQREARSRSPRWARPAPTTSCAPRSSRWCSTCPPTRPSRTPSPGCASCTRPTGRTTRATTTGTRPPTPPPSAAPTRRSSSCPGVGMFSYGKDKQTARVAGEFYVNAINVMRGAEAVSTYAPIDESEKFRIEYWALEEAKLAADAQAEAATPAGSPWSPAPPPASARPSPPGSPPRAPAWSSPTSTWPRPQAAAAELGGTDVAVGVAGGRHRRGRRSQAAVDATPCSPSAASTWWSTTPGCPSPSRCWRPPRPTGTCSTTSWPRAASWCRRRPRR